MSQYDVSQRVVVVGNRSVECRPMRFQCEYIRRVSEISR